MEIYDYNQVSRQVTYAKRYKHTCFPVLLTVLLVVKFMSFVNPQPIGVPRISMFVALHLRYLRHIAYLATLDERDCM